MNRRIHDGIHILAALNPYRQKSDGGKTPGLVFKHKNVNTMFGTSDLSSLVYRVAPVPSSLRDFVFDFGALPEEQEIEYIHQMVRKTLLLPSLGEGFIFPFSI